MQINPFYANVLFLYSLKTSETKGFLTFSASIEIGHWRKKGLIQRLSSLSYVVNSSSGCAVSSNKKEQAFYINPFHATGLFL